MRWCDSLCVMIKDRKRAMYFCLRLLLGSVETTELDSKGDSKFREPGIPTSDSQSTAEHLKGKTEWTITYCCIWSKLNSGCSIVSPEEWIALFESSNVDSTGLPKHEGLWDVSMDWLPCAGRGLRTDRESGLVAGLWPWCMTIGKKGLRNQEILADYWKWKRLELTRNRRIRIW